MTNPTPYYLLRAEEFTAAAEALRSRYDRLAYVRLIAFLIGIAIIIYGGSIQWYFGLLAALVFFPLFIYFVKWHQQLAAAATHAEHLAGVASAELMALDHEYDRWPDGSRFIDALHPYAGDLDIFGPHSLFQFINRCSTANGEQQLADFLLAATPTPQLLDRQKAIDELSLMPEWCHEFRARGIELDDDPTHQKRLLQWIELEPMVSNNPGLKVALWIIPLLFAFTIYLFFVLPVWQIALLGWLPVVLIMRKHGEAIAQLHSYTGQVSEALQHYANLLGLIETAGWKSSRLNELQQPLKNADGAARALRQLRYASGQLDVRYNAFSILLELSGLWSLQWIYRLEKWRARYRQKLPGWFAALAEIDALVSMGNLRLNQPQWNFAVVSEKPGYFGVSIGHPLLHPDQRITNDLDIATDGHIQLVTGSNMAGKSTWLRTVGINIVLALAGAPVCAKELKLPQLQVWTSMRTQDALHESTSSFFAELKRLKAIIEAVEAPDKNVFFLLDEILKGTNSRDRHTGARALIRQLIQDRGAGLIATHDLELAEMEKEAGSHVENYAMEVQIEDGQLVFDYKLKRGVSQSFNATVLMAEMGIRIAPEDIQVFR